MVLRFSKKCFLWLVLAGVFSSVCWAAEVAGDDEDKYAEENQANAAAAARPVIRQQQPVPVHQDDVEHEEKTAAAAPASHQAGFVVDNLKGSLTCIPSEMQDLAPFFGAVAWKKGVLQRLYDLGPMQENEPYVPRNPSSQAGQEERCVYSDAKKKHDEWVEKINSPSIKLIRNIFYRTPGSIGNTDFKVTGEINRMESKKIVAAIARTLADVAVHELASNEQGKLNLSKKQFALPRIEVGNLKSVFRQDKIIATLGDTTLPGYKMVKMALLAALWEKCGNDKKMLNNYCEQLKSRLEENIRSMKEKIASLPQNKRIAIENSLEAMKRSTENINPSNMDQFSHESSDIQTLRKKVNGYGPDELTDQAKLEEVAFVHFSGYDQPDDIKFRNSTLVFNGQIQRGADGKELNVPDCMDSGIRTFINHLIFDSITQTFDIKKLEDRLKHPVGEKLRKFYQKFSTPQLANLPDAYNEWMDVISNIPFVSYDRSKLTGPKEGGYVLLPEGLSAYKPLSDFLQGTGKSLIKKQAGDVLYELTPSYDNLTVLFNHIFNMKALGRNDNNLADKFIELGDKINVQRTFPAILQGLGIDCHQQIENPLTLTLANKTKPYSVTFKVTPGHGEVFSNRLPAESIPVLEEVSAEQLKKLPASVSFLLSEEKFKNLSGSQKPHELLLPFFAQQIDDPNKIVRFEFRQGFHHLVPEESKGESHVADSFVGKFHALDSSLLSVCLLSLDKNPNTEQRVLGKIEVYKKAMDSGIDCCPKDVIKLANEALDCNDNIGRCVPKLLLHKKFCK